MSGALHPDAAQLTGQMTAFLNFCRLEKGLSVNSLNAYSADLSRFSAFLGGASGIPGTEDLRRYLDHLYSAGLTSRSVARHLTTLRSFYGFLLREGRIESDPTAYLKTPHTWHNIPK